MKPAAFEYDDPRTVDEALDLLARHGEDAKVLAGGQSLVPLLNFRLARPERLIDVNRIDELAHLRRRDGALRIGALVRMATLARSRLAAERWPLLVEAVLHVGHPQIRSRGTVGGSAAHADPLAELPVALTALEARFHVRSARASRTLAAAEFFTGPLASALEPDELLVEIEVLPVPSTTSEPNPQPTSTTSEVGQPDQPSTTSEVGEGTGHAFVEYARRHGDFALAGAAVAVTLDDGTCTRARIGLLGAGPTPLRAEAAEQALAGRRLDADAAREAAELAARDADPGGDADHRRALLRSLVRHAVMVAASRA